MNEIAKYEQLSVHVTVFAICGVGKALSKIKVLYSGPDSSSGTCMWRPSFIQVIFMGITKTLIT